MFGAVKYYIYSIEWQKLGLPHLHILLWLLDAINPNDIDKIISAEIPNKLEDPILHDLVMRHMIHGPCGQYNPKSPCMNEKKCCKKFPKHFVEHTQIGNDGYPAYKRRSKNNGGNVGYLNMKKNNVWTNFEVENK